MGELADLVRRRKNGNAAYYNLNLHLNPTNVCIYRCAAVRLQPRRGRSAGLHDDRRPRSSPGPRRRPTAGCTELHVVGGVHPQQEFDWYLGIIRDLHAAFPRLHLKAWTAVEIDRFAQATKRPVRAILEELMAAGLGSLPGGGAEIFDPRGPHANLPPQGRTPRPGSTSIAPPTNSGSAPTPRCSTATSRASSTAWTTSCGSATCRTRPAASRLRAAGVPSRRTPALSHLPPASALEDLRVMAVSRLMLDNFDHIKAYWISLGVGTAQTALAYGADDLDGTVRHERIHHAAGAQSPESCRWPRSRPDRRGRPRARRARFALPPGDTS